MRESCTGSGEGPLNRQQEAAAASGIKMKTWRDRETGLTFDRE